MGRISARSVFSRKVKTELPLRGNIKNILFLKITIPYSPAPVPGVLGLKNGATAPNIDFCLVTILELGVVARVCNSSTRKGEAGGFEVCLDYIWRPVLEKP